MLEVRLLGQFDVRRDGQPVEIPSRPAQSLLAYLLLTAGTAHRREKLAGLLWPDATEANARTYLRQALWRIRKSLETDPPPSHPHLLVDEISIAFDANADYWLDAAVLEQATGGLSPDDLMGAVAVYRGELLPGFYDEWAVVERERLQLVFERKMQRLLERLVEAQRWREVLEWGERWITLGHGPEPAYRALMVAHAGLSDLASVAAVFQRCVEALRRELGVEPSEQTRTLYERLARGEVPVGVIGGAPLQARYRLGAELGRGGMGVVYRARDILLDRPVAVKVLSETKLGAEGRARLLREAQAAAKLNHPNIVSVYDAGESEGTPFIVMELVEGISLHRRPPQTLAETLAIARQVCVALEHAHAHGLIHRDLKPENVMLAPDGAAKLMDFGLAHSAVASRLTEEGVIVGTVFYLAPEMLRGQEASPQSDLYALGVMLYELTTARHPFSGEDVMAIISQHMHAEVVPPSTHNLEIPPALDALILRLLNKNAEDRPASAAEVRQALEAMERAEVPWEAPAPGEPPFKGLQYFDEADADWFFGREALVAQLVGRLRDQRFLSIVGASGSGKSSVVRAGLVPALKRGQPLANGILPPEGSNHWRKQVITPTAHPLEALAASFTRDSDSVKATATLMDDMASDPRSLHLYAGRLPPLTAGASPFRGEGGGGEGRLLLIVDQFEELFTLCRDEDERQAFINNLLTAAAVEGPTIVVIALRADFYAHCAQYDNLREALANHQEYIGRMTAEELRRTIEEPAKRGADGLRWEFEPGLVDLFLREVGDEPGALPLLSHALLETWHRRRGRTLTLKGYAESGGVRGAIAKTAETVFNRHLTPEQQAIARNIFLRLTELGEGTRDTRRRAALSELITHPELQPVVESVLKTLADARLITLSEDTAEVAHEALIREWPTLRQWLREDREGLRLHRHLTEAAKDWDDLERDPGALYRSARLAQTLEWANLHATELNALEHKFLLAAQEWAEREAVEREAQRQRELEAAQKLADAEKRRAEEQARSARQLRRRAVILAIALMAAGVLAVAAIGFGLIARQNASVVEAVATSQEQILQNQQTAVVAAIENQSTAWAASTLAAAEAQSRVTAEAAAVEQSEAAQEQARLAFARELALAATNNLSADPQRSLLLALEAISATYPVNLSVPFEVQNALHAAVQASRVRLIFPDVEAGLAVVAVAFGPADGRLRVATTEPNTPGAVTIWLAESGQALLRLSGHTAAITGVAFSPDGTRLATASDDTTAKIWDASTGQELFTLAGHTAWVGNPVFSPDGTRLATFSGADGTMKMWDVALGRELFTALSGAVYSLAFSPDGKRVATGNLDMTADVWDAFSGQQLLSLPHTGVVEEVVFSPLDGGARLATAVREGAVIVWDAASGEELLSLPEGSHSGPVLTVAFSPDGTRLVTGGDDTTAKVWDATTGQELLTLAGHLGAVERAAFSPDGMHLVTASSDGTARVWDLSPSHELLTLGGHQDFIFGAAFSPDGTRLATASRDGTAIVWDVATGKELLTLRDHTGWVNGVAFSPDGARLATASEDRTAKIWDAASGRELLTLSGHLTDTLTVVGFFSGVTGVAYSPDGARLATAGMDGVAIIWDATTGEKLWTLPSQTSGLTGVAFSPDGARLAATSISRTAFVWDTTTGELLHTLSGHTMSVRGVAFNSDGTRLATGSFDATAIIWDSVSGEALLSLSGQSGIVAAVAFSPDGQHLATASNDAKLWDAASGQELLSLAGSAQLTAVAFSPLDGGTRLATAGLDGTVRVYLLRIEDLVALAQSRVTRRLTTEECQQYLHVEQCPTPP